MAGIQIAGVTKSYGPGAPVIHGVDLDIADGELVVLVGPSGCGKSTLLRMIAGLETISGGQISIGGRVINDVEPADRDIAMVFQNYALYPHMTVRRNLEYGLKNRGTPREEIAARVAEAARILEIEPYLDRRPAALSGGQRQRVAMGRAIVRQPAAFLFDEPLSNLDAKLRGHMRVEIRRLQRSLAATSVYVTHDQLEAMTLADRLVVMNAGRIEQIGRPIDLYSRPASLFVAGFIGAPPMNQIPTAALAAITALPDAVPAGAGIIGIRPEHVVVDGAEGLQLSGQIELIESLGGSAVVHVAVAGLPQLLVVQVPGIPAFGVGDGLSLAFPLGQLHCFDAQSGARIALRGEG